MRGLLCRLLKHKISGVDDFTADITCSRCGLVLSRIDPPKKPLAPEWDRSYTNGCRNKTRFASLSEANARMDRMKSRPATLHGYFCKHCRGFHLGNSKPVQHHRFAASQ